jgi:hypothetical protein
LSIKFAARPLIAFVFATSLSFLSAAQQTPPPSNPVPPASGTETSAQPAAPGQQNSPEAKGQGAPATSPQSPSDKDKDKDGQSTSSQGKSTGTSNDRLFFTLPNFLTLQNAGQVPPLTPGKKFKVVLRGSFDYVEYAWYAAVSGVGQAENSEPAYRQGAEGYGKRYATNFADGTIENFMVGAVFPSLLHQDPRFFQSSEGGFWHRADYAVSRIFVTRADSGHPQFNYSEIIGSALSATISTNTYHPRSFITTRWDPATNMPTYVFHKSDRTLPNTLSVWGTQLGYDTITIVVKEFWPDIHRKLTHKHKTDAAAVGNANP